MQDTPLQKDTTRPLKIIAETHMLGDGLSPASAWLPPPARPAVRARGRARSRAAKRAPWRAASPPVANSHTLACQFTPVNFLHLQSCTRPIATGSASQTRTRVEGGASPRSEFGAAATVPSWSMLRVQVTSSHTLSNDNRVCQPRPWAAAHRRLADRLEPAQIVSQPNGLSQQARRVCRCYCQFGALGRCHGEMVCRVCEPPFLPRAPCALPLSTTVAQVRKLICCLAEAFSLPMPLRPRLGLHCWQQSWCVCVCVCVCVWVCVCVCVCDSE
jgi:hypothetical protein